MLAVILRGGLGLSNGGWAATALISRDPTALPRIRCSPDGEGFSKIHG